MSKFLGRVVVYSIVGCPHCLAAKSSLADLGVPYTEVSLDKYNEKVREEVKKRAGGKTSVPQIFFNSVHIGGNAELQKLIADKTAWKAAMEKVRSTAPAKDGPNVPDPANVSHDVKIGDLVCEPDEYVRLVNEMKAANLIKDHSKLLRSYKNSFSGAEFVDWIVNVKKLDECRALAMGQELISQHFGHTVKGDEEKFTRDGYYRLIEDDETKALNGGAISECAPVAPNELGEHIRKTILNIYAKFISPDGKEIDYTAMKKSSEFADYNKLVRQLQRVDIADADRSVKLAFFVNIYNALVVHATAVYGVPTSTWQRYKFFNTAAYVIGGHIYSLQDVENGVLRGNRKGVGMLFKSFGDKDVRKAVALSPGEPLVHFALNCGAKSCPPIKTFSAKNIDKELRVAAEAFLESTDGCVVDVEKNEVHVSQIFKWYIADFGGTTESVLQFVIDHVAEGEKKENLITCQKTGKCKVKYSPYDWGSNAKK